MTENNENSQISFASFGVEFQEQLAFLMFHDANFCEQIGEVLKTEFFEKKYLQEFIDMLQDYKKKYKTHPNTKTMKMLLGNIENNSILKNQLIVFFGRLNENLAEVENSSEYIKNKSMDFCRKQKIQEAMLKSLELMKKSSFDDIQSIMIRALQAGSGNGGVYKYVEELERRYNEESRDHVPTGWDEIDRIISGGHGIGELGVIVAPTSSGKSMLLVHFGKEAVKRGKNVIHISLELRNNMIAKRYDAAFTGKRLDDLSNHQDSIRSTISELPGNLILKYYPTKSASVNTIRSFIEKKVAEGFKPDLIIIDYGDLLKPSDSKGLKREDLEIIFEEMRGIAGEFDCALWTATQTNRTGWNNEFVDLDAISEAFNKIFPADLVITLSRNNEDKVQNTARFYIAKNKNGPEGYMFNMNMDTSRVFIKVASQCHELPSSQQSSKGSMSINDIASKLSATF